MIISKKITAFDINVDLEDTYSPLLVHSEYIHTLYLYIYIFIVVVLLYCERDKSLGKYKRN